MLDVSLLGLTTSYFLGIWSRVLDISFNISFDFATIHSQIPKGGMPPFLDHVLLRVSLIQAIKVGKAINSPPLKERVALY